MDPVKVLPPLPPWAAPHVAALGGRLLQIVRHSLAGEDWQGLRVPHFRLLGFVPSDGTTITDLAEVLHMTKQAVGQFVTHLEGTGHLAVRTDEAYQRRRVVALTAEGDATVAAVEANLAELERGWSELRRREVPHLSEGAPRAGGPGNALMERVVSVHP